MTRPATVAPVASPAIAQIKSTHFDRDVYEPSDDSFLLVDALAAASSSWKTSPPRLCVEIGSGSGYVISSVALLLAQNGISAQCIAVDINSAATHATAVTLDAHKVSCVDVVQSDLLKSFQPRLNGLIDLLVFNPPYVPTPDEEVNRGGIAAAWAGGHRGRVVIDRVLNELDTMLSAGGHLYMVTVAENDPRGILEDLKKRGFDGCCVLARQADEESLSILHIWRRLTFGVEVTNRN